MTVIQLNKEIIREMKEIENAFSSNNKWRKVWVICFPRYEFAIFVATDMWKSKEGWRMLAQLLHDNINIAKAIMEGKI
jgi:hypothetical protein